MCFNPLVLNTIPITEILLMYVHVYIYICMYTGKHYYSAHSIFQSIGSLLSYNNNHVLLTL